MIWKDKIQKVTLCLLLASLFLTSCLGWGDIFAKRERIIGEYFLSETEDGYYELFKGNIGRSPKWKNIIEYGILDSILIYKAMGIDSISVIGGINMLKDNEVAPDSVFNLCEEQAYILYKKLREESSLIGAKIPHSGK